MYIFFRLYTVQDFYSVFSTLISTEYFEPKLADKIPFTKKVIWWPFSWVSKTATLAFFGRLFETVFKISYFIITVGLLMPNIKPVTFEKLRSSLSLCHWAAGGLGEGKKLSLWFDPPIHCGSWKVNCFIQELNMKFFWSWPIW